MPELVSARLWYLHSFHYDFLVVKRCQVFVQGKRQVTLARAHIGDVNLVVELGLAHHAVDDFNVFAYLFELVLHVGHDLALARGETEQVPPRLRRVDETLFLMVVTQILRALFLHELAHESGLAFLADK